MQQELVRRNNTKFQQRNNKLYSMYQHKDKLDIEIDMMRKLMMNIYHRRNIEERKIINIQVKLIVHNCINETGGVLQTHVWDPGELQVVKTTQQDNIERRKFHYYVWDPRGL
jgi:hypothetical protein